MNGDAKKRATELVTGLGQKGPESELSAEQLIPIVYDELRRLAASYMVRERAGHTLQPTALVNEAFLKLVDQTRVNWRGRTHFFAVGANVMRRLLIDHARGRDREKRGADWQRVTLSHGLVATDEGGLDADQLLDLDAALDRLAKLDPRQARIVELRFFCGLTVAEVADFLGVSKRLVEGEWMHARVWLKRELAT